MEADWHGYLLFSYIGHHTFVVNNRPGVGHQENMSKPTSGSGPGAGFKSLTIFITRIAAMSKNIDPAWRKMNSFLLNHLISGIINFISDFSDDTVLDKN